MKKLILLSLLICVRALAIEGMITVLEAPLFKEQNTRSAIYQYARLGEILYINNRHVDRTYLTQYRPEDHQGLPLATIDDSSDFYATTDRIGRTVYVLKKHVKIIYKDLREKESSLTRTTPDETDYRLKGQLPPNYPFQPEHYRRSAFYFGLQQGESSSYPYPQPIASEEMGARFFVLGEGSRKVDFDPMDRIYFGGRGGIQFFKNTFQLESGANTQETNFVLKIGPFISYDFYKVENYLLTLVGGINFNYHLLQVTQDSDDGYRDRQLYDAFFITPQAGVRFSWREIFKDMDLSFGPELSLQLPYTLKTKGVKYEAALWNEQNDRVKQKTAIILDTYLGLNYKF